MQDELAPSQYEVSTTRRQYSLQNCSNIHQCLANLNAPQIGKKSPKESCEISGYLLGLLPRLVEGQKKGRSYADPPLLTHYARSPASGRNATALGNPVHSNLLLIRCLTDSKISPSTSPVASLWTPSTLHQLSASQSFPKSTSAVASART
jgi:hypothetical protein